MKPITHRQSVKQAVSFFTAKVLLGIWAAVLVFDSSTACSQTTIAQDRTVNVSEIMEIKKQLRDIQDRLDVLMLKSGESGESKVKGDKWISEIKALQKQVRAIQRSAGKMEQNVASIKARLNTLETKQKSMDADIRSLKSIAATDAKTGLDPRVLNMKKVYINQPLPIFSGQVLIKLIYVSRQFASFDIVLPDMKVLNFYDMTIGTRKQFTFQDISYFFELMQAERKYAVISITQGL